jgi:flagellar M-ring protein FliF
VAEPAPVSDAIFARRAYLDVQGLLPPPDELRTFIADTAPGKDARPATRRKRTPEEMKAIEQLARAAIGVDDQRGDLLAIENLSFQVAPAEPLAVPGKFDKYRLLLLPWIGALRYVGITLLFLLVYALVLRPVKKQAIAAFRQIPEKLAQAAAAVPGEGALASIELPAGSVEAKRATQIKKELTDKIKSDPSTASRLVQTWIREQPKGK